jgi:hypothetical protein
LTQEELENFAAGRLDDISEEAQVHSSTSRFLCLRESCCQCHSRRHSL